MKCAVKHDVTLQIDERVPDVGQARIAGRTVFEAIRIWRWLCWAPFSNRGSMLDNESRARNLEAAGRRCTRAR